MAPSFGPCDGSQVGRGERGSWSWDSFRGVEGAGGPDTVGRRDDFKISVATDGDWATYKRPYAQEALCRGHYFRGLRRGKFASVRRIGAKGHREGTDKRLFIAAGELQKGICNQLLDGRATRRPLGDRGSAAPRT